MGKFSRCPNCGHKPYQGFLGGWFDVYKCKSCGKLYCHSCGKSDKCPECSSKGREKAGQCV